MTPSERIMAGHRVRTTEGYWKLYLPFHPNAPKTGLVFEHRVVAERTLGRLLSELEVVHHWNGDPEDNRPKNLVVCTPAEHRRLHGLHADVVAVGWARYVARRDATKKPIGYFTEAS